MKRKVEKYVLPNVAATLLLLIAVLVLLFPVNQQISDYHYGSRDGAYNLYVQALQSGERSEEDVLSEIEDGAFSQPVVAQFLNAGYLRQYEERLKAGGWLAQDYVIPSGSSGNTNNSDSSGSAESSSGSESNAGNETGNSQNTGNSGDTSNTGSTGNSESTKPATPEYTEEEIAAAWVESKRTDATCTEKGSVVYKNTLTGKKKTEDISAKGHSYEISDQTASTCIEKGITTYTCAACGDSYSEESDLIEHNYEVTEDCKATCTDDGSVTYKCTMCEDSYTETVEAKGHVRTEQETVTEPGAFTEGLAIIKCENCGDVLEEITIEQKGIAPVWYAAGGFIIVFVIITAITIMLRKKKKKAK